MPTSPASPSSSKKAPPARSTPAKIKNAQVLVLDKETACVLEVIQGKADAFIYDQMSTYANWKRNPDTTRPCSNPSRPSPGPSASRKGNDTLKQKVNAFLKDYRAKGGFDKFGDKCLSDQKAAFKQLNVPFVF